MNPTGCAGITSVELVPGTTNGEVASVLRKSLAVSKSLRAAVAYWCVGPDQFGPDLVSRLRGRGFLCVDIHLPTDIDLLAEMSSSGANVFLHLRNPNPQPGERKIRMPPYLLHPKVLLFDHDTQPAELWVGSHNWTARALLGINIEASLRVQLTAESVLYSQAETTLTSVRNLCEPFDITAIDYYKWLQEAGDEGTWVISLSGARSLLDAHRMVTVFVSRQEDYRNLKSVDRTIVISLIDPTSHREALFEATVVDTGHLAAGGLAANARLYASQSGARRPVLQGPAIPPPTIRNAARSWATVEVLGDLTGEIAELPPRERWVEETNENWRAPGNVDLAMWFSAPERPLVQRAIPREMFENRPLAVTNACRCIH